MAATGDKYLMGIRTGQAQQELSMRQKAFEYEQELNNRKFPLLETQLRIQTDSLKLQQDQQRQAFDLQNANMKSVAAISPHLLELDAIFKTGDTSKLLNYEAPDVQINTGNPLLDSYASTLAKQSVVKYKKQLLENDQIFKAWNDSADKALSVAGRYDTPSTIKMQLMDMAPRLRNGGLAALTDYEKTTLLPYADRTAYAYSPENMARMKLQMDMDAKAQKAETEFLGVVGKTAGNILAPLEMQKAGAEVFIKGVRARQEKRTMGQQNTTNQYKPTTTEPKDEEKEAIRLEFKQAMEAVRGGASALEAINKLSESILKINKSEITPESRLGAQIQILNAMRQNGLELPFTAEDLSGTSQNQE